MLQPVKIVRADRHMWPALFRLYLQGGKGRRLAQREASKLQRFFQESGKRLHYEIIGKTEVHLRKRRATNGNGQ